MKLQNLTIIFIIIIIPVILVLSLYISTGIKTIKYQSLYDTGLLTATHDAIYAFELNTTNEVYSNNAETKRNILKSSVKAFEKSLCNTCNISSYNTDEIEEYIPAIVFGMYDGFYMYAPSYNSQTKKYEHNLKNYVYYSETLDDGTVIRYSLDNYITVSGNFSGKYEIKEGYLIDLTGSSSDGTVYKGINIDTTEKSAIKYYKEAYYFSKWFENNVSNKATYLKIGSNNDPENENSAFVQHKKEIMKEKIENVLNSSISAYSNRTFGKTYKMPKLTEEDWQKIYSNISMITFFQGKNIGLSKYNGYCVLNSTNNNEYVNSNLMYFIDNNSEYHDIRCTKKSDENLAGYKIGDFEKIATEETDDDGNTTRNYEYKHKELACYDCINGHLDTEDTIQEYVGKSSSAIKTSYWTSLARERYNTPKILDTACVITYELNELTASNTAKVISCGESFTTIITPKNSLIHRRPKEIQILMGGKLITGGYTYNDFNGEIKITEVTGDVIIIATAKDDPNNNVSAKNAKEVTMEKGENKITIEANINQARSVRVFKFIPKETAKYVFYSADKDATSLFHDPYAYLYDSSDSSISVDALDKMFLEFANSGTTDNHAWMINNEYFANGLNVVTYDDDSGGSHGQKLRNFWMAAECEEGKAYYLVIRSWNLQITTNFTPIYIEKQ